MMEKRVDAYIEIEQTDSSVDYNMHFCYNGVKTDLLYEDSESAEFARHFTRKFYNQGSGLVFMDAYGRRTLRQDVMAVLGAVRGLDHVEQSLIGLSLASENLDVQSDLFVHLGDEMYQLVGNVDSNKFESTSHLKDAEKGYSLEALLQVTNHIQGLKSGMQESLVKSMGTK